MKVVCKPVEMIAYFDGKGVPNPIRFRFSAEDGRWITVKVERVLTKRMEKLAGNNMYVFTCQSTIRDQLKVYELKYELDSCSWILFKI